MTLPLRVTKEIHGIRDFPQVPLISKKILHAPDHVGAIPKKNL